MSMAGYSMPVIREMYPDQWVVPDMMIFGDNNKQKSEYR